MCPRKSPPRFTAAVGLAALSFFMVLVRSAAEPAARPAASSRPSDPRAVIVALLVQRPDRLSELEMIVGSLQRDRSQWEEAKGSLERRFPGSTLRRIRVGFGIDPFHANPLEVEDPGLVSYAVDFLASGGVGLETATRDALRAAYGPPRELIDGQRAVLRFADFYLAPAAGTETFTLSWQSREPVFAIPHRSAAESAWLARGLAGLAKGGFSRAAVEARFGRLAYDPDLGCDAISGETWRLLVRPRGAAAPQEVRIDFRRPLDATSVLRAFGVERPAVAAIGSHLQGRAVVDLARPRPFPYLRSAAGFQVSFSAAREGLTPAPAEGRFTSLWRGDPILLQSFRAWVEASPVVLPPAPARP